MNIKSVMAALALALLSCGMLSSRADAAFINGRISFNGTANLDTQNLSTATQVVTWSDTQTAGGNTGSFAAIPFNTPVTFHAPWSFNSGPILAFWTSNGFTFDLLASAANNVTRTSNFLQVSGTGTISGNGYQATPGNWTFTLTDASGGGSGSASFAFAASTAAVPEGGSALALLGIGLVAVELIRRKVATA